ncbi:hypothetical protein [Streptococcus halotolerans]|uniref:hypothetical protein n=1 Tax=Streptococcus halotolerans TaxID=1814128 RepID=UPI000AEC7702|nr:hypothetical protein [Streptococcus halotolerans]QBX08370.1 hypothetical protein JavanS251_0012 [Streptococcus satellite phage Javan251]
MKIISDNETIESMEDFEKIRLAYMADNTPVTEEDLPKLLEIAEKLRNEDTSLNLYELQKHPDARSKLFEQITDACYMMLELAPTTAQRMVFYSYLEGQFIKTLAKQASRTDVERLNQVLTFVNKEDPNGDLKALARELVTSGLFTKES